MHFDYKTKDTCSQLISLDIEGDVVRNIQFQGGCNGNMKAVRAGGRLDDGADRIEAQRHSLRPPPDLLRGSARQGHSCAAYEAQQGG